MSVEPNENGVYPKGAAECIAWPGGKGHNLRAEIYVLSVDGMWLGAIYYQTNGSDWRGGCWPLSKKFCGPDHADRQSCIAEQARRIIRSFSGSDCKAAPAIIAWCEDLINGPDQMDLFGAAA